MDRLCIVCAAMGAESHAVGQRELFSYPDRTIPVWLCRRHCAEYDRMATLAERRRDAQRRAAAMRREV